MASAKRSISFTEDCHEHSSPARPATRRSASMVGPGAFSADTFSSRHLSLRTQKKLVSSLASRRTIVKIFLEEAACRIFDNVFKLVHVHTSSAKEANKIMSCLVKINMKVGVLCINDVLSEAEQDAVWNFRESIREVASLVLLYAGRPTWDIDLGHLIQLFRTCESHIFGVVQTHLSPRSVEHLRTSTNFFADRKFLQCVYDGDKRYKDVMASIVEDVQYLVNKGIL